MKKLRYFYTEWCPLVGSIYVCPSFLKAQIIGLGSVLITTVAFTTAFTIPGGYNQDHGTPIFGRKYVNNAFTVANALSFVEAFVSLFALFRVL
jgi:Domain of unknown function